MPAVGDCTSDCVQRDIAALCGPKLMGRHYFSSVPKTRLPARVREARTRLLGVKRR